LDWSHCFSALPLKSILIHYKALPRQNTLAQIRQNRLLAYAQLYRALGGGWAPTDAQSLGQGEATTK
jgi:hypothetical protein